MPLVTDSATFSASWRQQVTSKKLTCSSDSLVWRLVVRWFHANPNVATAAPPGVKRSSGSRVTLPTRTMVLSNAMAALRSSACGRAEKASFGRFAVGQADDFVADDFVREAQVAIERVEACRR